jgi:hypothetical protein
VVEPPDRRPLRAILLVGIALVALTVLFILLVPPGGS